MGTFAPQSLPDWKRAVLKVGSSLLAAEGGGLSPRFALGLAQVVLAKLGVISVEKMKDWRSYFIVGAFVVAAIVTPPSVISQLALAIPMCLLYELGLLASRLVSPQENAKAERA